MDGTKNTMLDLQKFFCTGENAVSTAEFREFWSSLSEAEKIEFKEANLRE